MQTTAHHVERSEVTARTDTIWRLSLDHRRVTLATDLQGRRGSLNYFFAVDSRFIYLVWSEDEGDIWVMDVVTRP